MLLHLLGPEHVELAGDADPELLLLVLGHLRPLTTDHFPYWTLIKVLVVRLKNTVVRKVRR